MQLRTLAAYAAILCFLTACQDGPGPASRLRFAPITNFESVTTPIPLVRHPFTGEVRFAEMVFVSSGVVQPFAPGDRFSVGSLSGFQQQVTVRSSGAGPGVALSFLLVALACSFAALCYAELASMIPVAGSAYTYAYATMGELFAWIIGWDLILEYAVGSMTVAIGWSGYMQRLLAGFGVTLPKALAAAPPEGIINLPAVIIVLAIGVLLVVGVRESARFNAAMVAVKLVGKTVDAENGPTCVPPGPVSAYVPAR